MTSEVSKVVDEAVQVPKFPDASERASAHTPDDPADVETDLPVEVARDLRPDIAAVID